MDRCYEKERVFDQHGSAGTQAGSQRDKLLMAELDHRVKNTIANIRALVVQTSRSVDSFSQLADKYQLIILDNVDVPDWLESRPSYIHFAGQPTKGRAGFFPALRHQINETLWLKSSTNRRRTFVRFSEGAQLSRQTVHHPCSSLSIGRGVRFWEAARPCGAAEMKRKSADLLMSASERWAKGNGWPR